MALITTRRRRRKRKRKVVKKPVVVKATPKPTPSPTPKPSPTPSPTPAPTTAPAPSPAPSTTPSPSATPTPTTPSPTTPSVPPGAPVPLVETPSMASTAVASARERLFLNRFGTGFSQRSLAQLRSVGTPEAWLAAQLEPSRIEEHPKIAVVEDWFASLRLDEPAARWQKQIDQVKGGWVYAHELGNYSMLRRVYSERTVLEKMVDFWGNALHVPANHDRAWIWRMDYDATVRQHALGRFEDLLLATALHPSMRLYLDNWRNVRDKPNENQGRELLELHTVGRGAGYTEAMVKDSAKILSGYTLDWGETFEPYYKTAAHTLGTVNVLGFTHANTSSDGQAVAQAYLRFLARHPATARNLATKLATYLVSDTPSAGLVDTVAQAYLDNDTSIPAMLTALASHPEFAASTGAKVRPPIDDMVATARVLQVDVNAATTVDGAWSQHANWNHGGAALFSWPRPDGAPLRNAAWSSTSRIFNSYDMHRSQAGGWWPKGATYATGATFLRGTSTTLDGYTDHLVARWFGRAADTRLRQAVQQATGLAGSTTVNASHRVCTWMFPALAEALLDTPDHMAP